MLSEKDTEEEFTETVKRDSLTLPQKSVQERKIAKREGCRCGVV